VRQQSVAQAAHSGWTVLPFGAAIDFQEGPGILAKDFRPHGVPLIRLSGLARGASVLDGCNYLDAEMVKRRWSHFALQAGDILLSTSASLGRIATVTPNASGAIAYTGVIRMRPRDPELLTSFIPYLLESEEFRSQAEAMGAGSVIRHFGPTHLKQMTVTIPPRQVQVAIVDTLSAYDELIENSQRRITILESMARALYREWFVHFRFPGHENHRRVASPLGEIPEGWIATSFREAARFENGDRGRNYPSAGDFVGDGVAFVNAGHLVDGHIDVAEVNQISESKFEQLRSGKIRPGDLLYCLRGSPGRTARATGLSRGAIASSLVLIRPTTQTTPEFLYCTLSGDVGTRMVSELNNGAAQPNISVGSVQRYPLVLPPGDILKQFTQVVEPQWRLADALRDQISTLRRTRDLLLPRLMSGQIDVSAA